MRKMWRFIIHNVSVFPACYISQLKRVRAGVRGWWGLRTPPSITLYFPRGKVKVEETYFFHSSYFQSYLSIVTFSQEYCLDEVKRFNISMITGAKLDRYYVQTKPVQCCYSSCFFNLSSYHRFAFCLTILFHLSHVQRWWIDT